MSYVFARRPRKSAAGLDLASYLNWNAVPWYVSATGRSANATYSDGQAALPYMHQLVSLLSGLRVVMVMGGFVQRSVAEIPASA